MLLVVCLLCRQSVTPCPLSCFNPPSVSRRDTVEHSTQSLQLWASERRKLTWRVKNILQGAFRRRQSKQWQDNPHVLVSEILCSFSSPQSDSQSPDVEVCWLRWSTDLSVTCGFGRNVWTTTWCSVTICPYLTFGLPAVPSQHVVRHYTEHSS